MARSEEATSTTAALPHFIDLGAQDEEEDEVVDEDYLSALQRVTVESAQQQLFVPNYFEDEAVRHATLAPIAAWSLDGDPPCCLYRHRTLDVQLRSYGAPLPVEEAREALAHCGERTLVTLRIALGLWNLRRADRHLCVNGDVAIHADDLLYWLGVEKHTKASGQSRRTDGWRPEEYTTLEWDLWFAASLWVTGTRVIMSRGKHHMVEVNDRYIRASFVRPLTTSRRLLGVFLSPGAWINDYHDRAVCFLTPLTRRIFTLHPHNDQHALRLALYLAERWRKLAFKRDYDTPINIEQLLHESAIAIPERNGQRFAARIEMALSTLQDRNIIGSYLRVRQCSSESRETRFNLNGWLASEWSISPPEDLVAALNQAVQVGRQMPSLRSRTAKKRAAA